MSYKEIFNSILHESENKPTKKAAGWVLREWLDWQGRVWEIRVQRMEMEMKRSVAFSLIFAIAACVLGGFLSGCETGGDTTGLTVTPSAYNTTNKSEAVTFTVAADTNTATESGLRELSLPLEWRVSNPLLGFISAQSGYSCTYVRNRANGIQTISVTDQYGAEGHATVDQQ